MNEQEPSSPKQNEALSRDGPRIYAASLSDYNDGILHGAWIDADDDVEGMQRQVAAMLERSPTAQNYGLPAEEWAIHDYEGFGDIRVSEHARLDTIARIAAGIREHGLAFAAWITLNGSDDEASSFDDAYLGQWQSVEEYAEELLGDLGADRIIDEAPQWLQPYLKLDVEGFARDLELGGDISSATADYGVWIFRAC